jgi:hypothetical protein
MSRRALATMLVFLLAGIPVPARPAVPNLLPLGKVTQASRAHFNAATVTAGATIYDGDGLSTEAEGVLQFRSPAALLYLPGSSGVTLHRLANSGTQAQLQTGTVVFSTARAAGMELIADEAFIHPLADGPTMTQVTIMGPKELQINARRGDLQFSYRGETEKLAGGSSYRILLDQPDSNPPPRPQQGPIKAGHESKSFKIIVIVAIGWVTEWAVHEVFESPDRP